MGKQKSICASVKKSAWSKVRFKERMFPGVEALFKRKGIIVGKINSSKNPTKTYFRLKETGTLEALFSPLERKRILIALIGRKKSEGAKISTKSTEHELEEVLHKINQTSGPYASPAKNPNPQQAQLF